MTKTPRPRWFPGFLRANWAPLIVYLVGCAVPPADWPAWIAWFAVTWLMVEDGFVRAGWE